jgi:hypothetical protein
MPWQLHENTLVDYLIYGSFIGTIAITETFILLLIKTLRLYLPCARYAEEHETIVGGGDGTAGAASTSE